MPLPPPRLLAAAGFAALLTTAPAAAHEGEDEALARVDLALAAAPRDASLWLRRADLERRLGALEPARVDLDHACSLGLAPALAERERGLAAAAADQPAEAEAHLRRSRELAPDDAATIEAHAAALARLARWREAADAYQRVIEIAPGAGPDLHLARVRALESAGAPREALRALDDAEARLGPVPALAQEGIALELRAGRPDAALARLDRLPGAGSRREGWHLQRAEILERAGRRREASAEYTAALASLAALPPARRSTPAAVAAGAHARDGLARLAPTAGVAAR